MPRKNYSAKSPKHQPFQPQRTCDDKKRYPTEKAALEAKEYQELINLGLELKVYACDIPGCQGWHLTKVTKS